MALNLDAALRVVAKVQGLNEFKTLTDSLQSVEGAAKNTGTGLQQVAAESGRVTQEASKATGSVKAQAAALQDLQTKTRAGAAELRRMGDGTKMLGSAVAQLRGQSSGAFEGLTGGAAKSANSIRELQRTIQPTDAQLAKLREEVLAFGAANKQTERSLEQQVQVLKNLRSQAELGGRVYSELTGDIERLSNASKGLGQSALFGVEGMKKLGTASQSSSQQIELQIKSLTRLQSTLIKGSEGYQAIGKEIDALKQKAASLDLSKGLNIPGAVTGAAASGVTGALANIVKLRQELAKTYTGRVALVGEGLGVAGAAGAAASGVGAGLGGLAGGAGAVAGSLDTIAAKAQALPAILRPLGNLLSEPASQAATSIANWGASLSAAQSKLAALAGPFEAINTAISSIGPEAAAAAGAASLAIAGVYGVLSRQADKAQADAEAAFKGISDDAQRMLEQMVRIYDRLPAARLQALRQLRDSNITKLGESAPDSVEARQAANAVAVAEREIAKIQAEQNQLLEQARQRQNAAAEALQRQVQAGRDKISTAREELSLAERIAQVQRQAADRRRAIADAEKQAAEAERNRLGAAAAAAAQPRVLALPGAGQTSFQGTVNAQGFGGGARARLGNFETAGTRDQVGAAMSGFSGAARTALNQQAEATDKARESLSKLFIEIDKAKAASNGSIQSLQRQRAAWEALRASVNPAAPAYEKARAKVQQLDEQLQKLTVTQEKATRRGLGREAVGGALGALATGGGIQGAVGSLAGSLAFSGGAGGLVAGGAITAVAGLGTLATRVGLESETAQVRLKALTDQFGEYNQAQAAAERIARTLRISQTEATDSFSKLYAALRPTGVTLKEVEDAYIGFTAAARASGATAEESSNALLQLKQALGSGVLQGDELRSIREQAPAVGQAIAKEMGVTVGELKKLGEEGKITTDIVLRALASLKDQNLGKLNAQFNTGAQALKDLQIATEQLGSALAKTFGPTTVALIQAFTRVLERIGDGGEGRQREVLARLQAGTEAQRKFGRFGSITNRGEFNDYINKRTQELVDQSKQAAAAARDRARTPNADQLKAQQDAAKEREAARERSAMEAAKKRLAEELKIREDTEKRLADFREQSIRRAADLERDLGDQRLQLERSTAEARRRITAQEADYQLERERLRLRANGLSTDQVDLQQRLNEATRRYTEQKIQIEQQATDRKVQLERTLEDYKITVARGISEILQDAADKMAQKMVGGARQAASELGGAGGGTAMPGSVGRGQLGVGNLVALARSAGFRGQDAAIMAAIAMAESGGRSSAHNNNPRTGDNSYGLWQINMLGGMGPQRRRAFGIGSNDALFDPAVNANAARQVFASQGFGAWSVYRSGAYKDYLPAAMAAARNGSARMLIGQSGASVPGVPGLAAAGRNLDAAIGGNRSASNTAALGDLIASRQAELGNITSELDQQRKSTGEQLRDYQRMVELQRSGLSPELAKQRVDAENAAVAEAAKLNTLRDQLVQDREIAGLTDKQKATIDAMIASIDARNAAQMQTVAGLTAEQQQLEQLRQAYEEKKQLVEGIANSIGNGIGSAIDLLIDGTDNWGDSLRSIAAGVLKDIARQIAQTMVVAPIVKGITSAFGFADGGIMTADGPVPLRKYAGGGIANSPQLALFGEGSMPEAYVPLPDGRRIPVAMKGGGGGTTTVNVSVDASGSQVQGDAGKGEQLGRAISQAVQAELVRQKRPGGLLAA